MRQIDPSQYNRMLAYYSAVPEVESANGGRPPDSRRCVPVPVASVPLRERIEAVRVFCADFVETPAERLTLFDLALDPPAELMAWVAPPLPVISQTNGRSRRTRRTGVPLSRAEVERIFELQAEGLSQREIGQRVGRARTSIMYVMQQGRQEALRRLGAREDRELEKLVREALQERLSQWHPSHTVARNAEGRPLRELPDVSRRAVRLAARGAPRVPAMRLKDAAILGRVNGDSRDAGGRLPAGNGPARGGERPGRSA